MIARKPGTPYKYLDVSEVQLFTQNKTQIPPAQLSYSISSSAPQFPVTSCFDGDLTNVCCIDYVGSFNPATGTYGGVHDPNPSMAVQYCNGKGNRIGSVDIKNWDVAPDRIQSYNLLYFASCGPNAPSPPVVTSTWDFPTPQSNYSFNLSKLRFIIGYLGCMHYSCSFPSLAGITFSLDSMSINTACCDISLCLDIQLR